MPRARSLGPIVLFAIAASGCGGIGSYCEDRTDCEGGSDGDLEACDIVFSARSDRAEIAGCADEFGAYLDCLSDTSTCEDDNYVPSEECQGLDEKLSECESQ